MRKMDTMKFIFVICLFMGAALAATNQRRRLIRHVVDNYEKLSPPLVKDNLALNVSHNVQVRRIVSLEDQVLTLEMYLSMFWRDDQFTWDAEDYGGIHALRLPSDLLWKPDIILENDADRSNGMYTSGINAVVYDDGNIIFIPPMKTKSYCSIDHSKIKRQSQVTCTLKFMSWTYDAGQIDLVNADASKILEDYEEEFNKDWKIVDHSVTRHVKTYDCCPGQHYVDLQYDFVLEKL